MTVNARFGFAVEYVADVAAAKRFYTEALGLEVARDHPTFVQFRDPSGDFFAIAGDEPMSEANPELYWLVDDAEAAARELAGKTEITHPLREMPFGKVFGVTDPDGQPRFLVEFARVRPSRRVS